MPSGPVAESESRFDGVGAEAYYLKEMNQVSSYTSRLFNKTERHFCAQKEDFKRPMGLGVEGLRVQSISERLYCYESGSHEHSTFRSP